MSNLLKDAYNNESLNKLALEIKSVYPPFPVDDFIEFTMDETWDNLELKDRCRKITMSLGKYLPANYSESIGIIDKLITNYGSWLEGIFGMFFLDYIEVFGQNEEDWDISISAIERYTPYESAEFAVRPFIINHEERMMAQMYAWSKHENKGVRRLASEGCRPQLPWAQSLPSFKKDPSPILPILEQLKNDPCEWVRKSVANNLNDISKTHPDLVIKIAKEWYGDNKDTDWIVKHACRTLLKKGNKEVLAIFGYGNAEAVNVENFNLEKNPVKIGEDLIFTFLLTAKKDAKVRLEYGIDYVKAKGKRSRKVFKISEVSFNESEKKHYTRKHSFADVSVRKHYPGVHSVTLIVNGEECGVLDFELM